MWSCVNGSDACVSLISLEWIAFPMSSGMRTPVPISNGMLRVGRSHSRMNVEKRTGEVMIDAAPIKYNWTPVRFLGIDRDLYFFFVLQTCSTYDSLHRMLARKVSHWICVIHVDSNGPWLVGPRDVWEMLRWKSETFSRWLRFHSSIASNCCYISYDILCLTNDLRK